MSIKLGTTAINSIKLGLTNIGKAYLGDTQIFGSVSPVTGEIVYINSADGDKLYKKNADDTNPGVAITTAPASFCSYSPDGVYIIYGNTNDNNRIYRKNANDALNGSAINGIAVFSGSAVYSPDGNFIYYIGSSGGQGNIYKKNAGDTSNGTVLTSFGSQSIQNVAVSPDGNTLAFTIPHVISGIELRTKGSSVVDNGVAQFVQIGPSIMYVNYSNDGQYIIYNGSNNYITRRNTSDFLGEIVLNSAISFYMSYSPDDSDIVYQQSGGGIFIKDATINDNGVSAGVNGFSPVYKP